MKRATLVLLALSAALVLAACGDEDDSAQASTSTCTGPFEATVYSGPSKGLSVKGDLTLEIEPSGSASGAVASPDGSEVPTAGQVEGRAISLAFDLGDGETMYGTGAASGDDIATCNAEFGGPLAGPAPGDSGDWKGRPGPSILN